MERDIGLDELSAIEKDILLAAHSLTANKNDVVASQQIRCHALVEAMAPASFHRALRSLLEQGFLERAGDSKAKSYVVRSDLINR